jgi:hypothetical protein
MYTLVIKDNEYKVPDYLSLDKWSEVNKYDIRVKFTWDRIISIVMDIPQDDVEIIPDNTKELIMLMVTTLINPLIVIPYKEVGDGKFIDLNSVTLGKFIDIELQIADGVQKNLKNIVDLLYETNIDKDISIKKVLGGVNQYLKWRDSIYAGYKNLFLVNGDEDGYAQDDDFYKSTVEDIKHSWFEIIMLLANEDILRMEQVTEQSVIKAFNWLAWNKDRQQKELDRQNDLQRNNRHI